MHFIFFFFNDTATTEIYTLSLHDALPISSKIGPLKLRTVTWAPPVPVERRDRKSTRLNSSHGYISYAVFCLKKKKKKKTKSKSGRIEEVKRTIEICTPNRIPVAFIVSER